MFWELYQHRSIAKADSKATRAQNRADQTLVYIERLDGKVETLALACQSLWELVREHTDLTEADLEAKMEEIDVRDGKLDGKMSKKPEACPGCGRKMSRRRATCLYCGEKNRNGETFGKH